MEKEFSFKIEKAEPPSSWKNQSEKRRLPFFKVLVMLDAGQVAEVQVPDDTTEKKFVYRWRRYIEQFLERWDLDNKKVGQRGVTKGRPVFTIRTGMKDGHVSIYRTR